MKMKHSPLVYFRLVLAGLILAAPCLWSGRAEFAPLPTGTQGLVDEGIAMFVPSGLDAAQLPYTPTWVEAPKIRGTLPVGWRTAPAFFSEEKRCRAKVAIGADDDLYGSGEVTGPLRRNGTAIELWNTDNYTYETAGGRRLYQSHPWILGVRRDGSAYGVIFDSTWKAELACADEIIFTSEGPAFPVLVIEKGSPAGVLQALAELTGKMPLPPRWALGYQQCRWSYYPDQRVREIADQFRQRKIPCDVLWMDIDYMDGFRVFTFEKKGFPDPAGLNAYLHERGFKSVWMIDPGVKVDRTYKLFNDGSARNVWVKTAAGSDFVGDVWPGACVFPDFTRPETRSWWSGLYRDFIRTGIDGVWNDMNEPAVFNVPSKTMPEDNLHRGGGGIPPGPHLRYHNIYGMLMVRATREGIAAARPDKRPFVLTRSNFLGGQRYAATWTGDNVSSAAHMKLSVPMTLSLGLSGQPFVGPDLGGFVGNATPQLWSQWVGAGVFFPFCRGHAVKDGNDKEPWAFGEQVERTARLALERRYRLLPYLYTLFREASMTGLPVMRPVFMADTADATLRREENAFLLGPDLLVVPAWANNPNLPKGTWREITLVDGDQKDPDQARLFLRGGAMVPLGRVVQNTTQESLEPMTLLACLDEKGRAMGRLYEDDGDGFGYQRGQYRLTTYEAVKREGRMEVHITGREGQWPAPARDVVLEVVDGDGVQTVNLGKTNL
ncbi:MAG: glycoside hydrolase family 31 protein [Nibricoccus sp.]